MLSVLFNFLLRIQESREVQLSAEITLAISSRSRSRGQLPNHCLYIYHLQLNSRDFESRDHSSLQICMT